MDWFRRERPRLGGSPDSTAVLPAWNSHRHPSEDLLEEYSFGRLDERAAAPLEEHLLLCERCRDSLELVEGFIQELKSAILARGGAHRTAIRPVASLARNIAWGAALSVLVLIATLAWPSREPTAPTTIALASFRGSQAVAMARGPAGRSLELALDAAGIGNSVRCRVEVVTVSGEKAWDGASNPQDGKLLALVPKGLRSGSYWVRLYASGNELVREFGLRLD